MDIIIIIIIIVAVMKNNKKKKEQEAKRSGTQYYTGYSSTSKNRTNTSTGTTAGLAGAVSRQYSGNVSSVSNNKPATANRQTTSNRTGGNSNTNGNTNRSNTSNVSKNANSNTNKKEQSTLEYLNKKAAEDQAAHMAEKRQQEIKQQQIYGDAKIGEMYMPGDSIPSGKMKAKCPYCAADNLIQSRYRANSLCYFCRTKL